MRNVKAKKKFGQNFLKDESVLNKIIQSMPQNNNHLVEIGPGLGDLTKKLVKCKDVTAFEVDRDLYSILQTDIKKELESNNLEIILGDVLEQWTNNNTLYNSKYDLIANLPYYIATNIILNCIDDDNCEHIIVMIQKEVADKFTAKCKDKEYSSLAVITQLISKEAKTLIVVPPESFDPAPKVDSAVIYIKKDLTKSIDDGFKKFLKVCFTSPRKKLSKNLSAMVKDKELLNNIFKELEINENVRPHEVDASLYSQIYTKVTNGRE
jgi:16S rRNA (adenine1518-N6/adenine1519-N6)-dimethyltransferase